MSKLQRRWSPQEDSILQREVDVQCTANSGAVRDWNSIAQKIKGRSNKDCRKRFYNGITEGLKKGPWTNEEDRQLEKFVKRHGTSWAVIAQDMKTRSADQCSKRWQHCLDPELDRSSWSQDENIALLNAVKTHESAWKDIQTLHFPRRSANNVKNQYSVLKRKALKVPADAPSCCSNMANVPAGIAPSPWISDDLSPSHPFEMELDQPSLASSNFEAGLHSLEHDFSFPTSDNEDPFKWLNSEFDSATVKTESRDDFNFLSSHEDFSLGTIPNLDLDLDICSDIDYTESVSSPDSFGAAGQESLSGHSSPPYEIFAHPKDFDVRHTPRHPSSPSSLTSPFSTLATPSTQLTIRMEGADPSTLSAVMGTLIQSKARFKFETH